MQLNTELVRVAIVHNSEGSLVSHAVQAALSSHSSLESLLAGVQALLSLPESTQESSLVDVCNSTLDSDEILELLYSAATNSTIDAHTRFSRTVLGLEAGQNALLSNGKVRHVAVRETASMMMFYCSLLDLCLKEKCSVKPIGTCSTVSNQTPMLLTWCQWWEVWS